VDVRDMSSYMFRESKENKDLNRVLESSEYDEVRTLVGMEYKVYIYALYTYVHMHMCACTFICECMHVDSHGCTCVCMHLARKWKYVSTAEHHWCRMDTYHCTVLHMTDWMRTLSCYFAWELLQIALTRQAALIYYCAHSLALAAWLHRTSLRVPERLLTYR
jgi:hypothetical protein